LPKFSDATFYFRESDVSARMREKLKTESGRAVYKATEDNRGAMFGQVKEVKGFRRFSFRGLQTKEAEWSLICLTHNLLKLFRGNYFSPPARYSADLSAVIND
jgi:DDE family transposase